jgi:hypothetical protein
VLDEEEEPVVPVQPARVQMDRRQIDHPSKRFDNLALRVPTSSGQLPMAYFNPQAKEKLQNNLAATPTLRQA